MYNYYLIAYYCHMREDAMLGLSGASVEATETQYLCVFGRIEKWFVYNSCAAISMHMLPPVTLLW